MLGVQNGSCGRSRLAARALNSARKRPQLLALLEIWCHAAAFGTQLREPAGWSRRCGLLPIPLRSQQPSQARSSPPATSQCFTKMQKCALGRGVPVTLFLFPAWKRSLLPSVQWFLSTSPAFHKVYRPFLPCYRVCFAERDVQAAKRCKFFFYSPRDASSLYLSQ